MICLACAAETAYGRESCGSCGAELPAFPPYEASNHICQLQLALAAYEEGQLTREALLARYATFAELAMHLDDRWGISQASLADRLGPALRPRYTAALRELDEAAEALQQALAHLDRWAETGDDSQLAPADELLTDFFRHTCGGCTALLDDLESEAPPLPRDSGALL